MHSALMGMRTGLSTSLRARRSNPFFLCCFQMDCFVASAPRNDGERAVLRRARFNFKQQMSVRILAARFARALHFVVPRKREQGMPGARCTRGLACKTGNKKAHEHTGQRRQSDIPCAMALRLIPRSSRRANSSCHRRCRLDSGSNPVGSISPPTAWHQQGVSEPRGFTVRNNAVRLRAVRSLTGLAQSRTRPAIHLRA
jgi:hypothetical protein